MPRLKNSPPADLRTEAELTFESTDMRKDSFKFNQKKGETTKKKIQCKFWFKVMEFRERA